MGQKSAAYDSLGAIVGFYDSEHSPVPEGVTAIEITDDQWQTCLSQDGWRVGGGALMGPTSGFLLDQARGAKVGALVLAYQQAVAEPVTFTATDGVPRAYQADAASISNLQNAILGLDVVGVTPNGFYWIAADNTKVPFTYADLQGLAGAMLTRGWAAFQRLQDRKTSVAAATSAADVAAISW